MNTLRTNFNKLASSVVATGLATAALVSCTNEVNDSQSSADRNAGCAITFDDIQLAEYGQDGPRNLAEDLAEAGNMSVTEATEELRRENSMINPDVLPQEGSRFVIIGQAVCNALKHNPEDGFYITQLTTQAD